MQDQPAADGVPGQDMAGTPFRVAHPSLQRAAADLEWAAVLEQVAALAAGPLGASRILARWPSTDAAWAREQLALAGEVLGLLRRGEAVRAEPVPDVTPALGRLRIEGSVLEPLELRDIARLLHAARTVSSELGRIAEEAPRVASLRTVLPSPGMDRRLELSVDDAGEVLDTASPALAAARREVHAARQRLVRRLEGILRGVDPDTSASVTLRGGRYVIPIRRDSRSRPAGIIHDESATAGTLFVEPTDAVEFGNAFREAQAEAEREVLRVLRELTTMLRPARDALVASLEMCVAFDDVVARARYAHAVAGEVPELLEPGGPLHLTEARHPLLLARGVSVVPFALALEDNQRTLLISGPNTGGKTVLLKSVALVAMMAQAGIIPPVGAGSAMPVFTRIFTDIGDRQSVADDLSTFSGHVASLRAILEGADRGSLVLLDEVGSGTDPAEGAALAAAILVELTARQALTLATTHLGALKSLAAATPGVVNGSLQFDTETLRPTYRFRKGVPGRSYGLSIARQLGIDPRVLADADGRVSSEERQLDALLARAEARDRELEGLVHAAREREVEVDALRAKLALQAESQQARERELASREKDADRRARAGAKRYLLEARREVEAAVAAARAAASDDETRDARRRVENAARALEQDGDGAADREHGAPAVSIGDRIRLTSGMTGDVIELRTDGKVVLAVGSMRLVADVGGAEVLTRRPGGPEARMPMGNRASGYQGLRASGPPGSRAPGHLEIDLRGMTGDEAETAAVAALDSAILAEQPFLRIIHGMGTGVVRDRVRQVLERDRRVAKFEFAPRNQGGTGVTVVEFAP